MENYLKDSCPALVNLRQTVYTYIIHSYFLKSLINAKEFNYSFNCNDLCCFVKSINYLKEPQIVPYIHSLEDIRNCGDNSLGDSCDSFGKFYSENNFIFSTFRDTLCKRKYFSDELIFRKCG